MQQVLSNVGVVSTNRHDVPPNPTSEELQDDPDTETLDSSDDTKTPLGPVAVPSIAEYQEFMNAAAAWAAEVGLTEDDIVSAVKAVRARRSNRAT